MEGYLLILIQEKLRNPVLNRIFVGITHLGDSGFIWLILAAVFFCFKKTRKASVCSFMALDIMVIGNEVILKHLINRTRPFKTVEGLVTLIEKPPSSSFPSGHTSSSFAVAMVLWTLLPRKYSVPCLILAGLIAFSRLFVGVHYPTDILGGMMIGVLYGFLGLKLGSLIVDSNEKRKSKQIDKMDEA